MNSVEHDKKLFDGFPPVTTEQWEQQIHTDLKGADYDRKLVWKTPEGIKVRPYYRAEDLEGLPYSDTLPGEFPFLRGNHARHNHWEVRQDVDLEDIVTANKIAVEAIERGAEGIGLNAKQVQSREDLAALIRFIELEKTAVHFIASHEYPFIAELLIGEAQLRGADLTKIRGSLGYDPFGYYLLHGDFYNSLDDNLDEAEYLIRKIRTQMPGLRVITVRGDLFHNAGATAVQELAFAISAGNEYLAGLSGRGIRAAETASTMQFTFSLGSAYFLEIAKIRAARLLWSLIQKAYDQDADDTAPMYIHGTTSLWNKSVFDAHVNMLRTTTEAMAGAVAGCDAISVKHYDITFRKPDDLSMRNARNTQIILREESYFGKVADPAAGSYYIENLTHSLAAAAWELFKNLESEGGYLKAVGDGKIRAAIEESAAARDLEIAKRSVIILGTNQYPNPNETMLDKVSETVWKEYPGLKLYRGAAGFEHLRLNTEKYIAGGNKRPEVFLFTIGNPGMRKARAAFASNFFGCSGFAILDNPGFETVDEGVQAALSSHAGIVVICSSDDEYATLGNEVLVKLKAANSGLQVVIAGNPAACAEELRQAGADEFIHVRSNVLETLWQFSHKLGIA